MKYLNTKIAIIGAGNVGCAAAFALLMRDLASEIFLVDPIIDKTIGESKDLGDVLAFSHTKTVRVGSYDDACKSDIVIISAGKAQIPGQPRSDLLKTNAQIMQSICKELINIQKNAIVIIVTNPLDALTYLAQKELPLPRKQIFGTGTWLDSQRLRRFIATKLNVTPHDVEAYMLGEHGDSQFAVYSQCKINNKELASFGLTIEELALIETKAKNEVYEIIQSKCATYYGIAACLADICKAIIYNELRILPLSVFNAEHDICISTFVMLGKDGINEIGDINLSDHERNLFKKSAEIIYIQIHQR